jgi:hypothetical protein
MKRETKAGSVQSAYVDCITFGGYRRPHRRRRRRRRRRRKEKEEEKEEDDEEEEEEEIQHKSNKKQYNIIIKVIRNTRIVRLLNHNTSSDIKCWLRGSFCSTKIKISYVPPRK